MDKDTSSIRSSRLIHIWIIVKQWILSKIGYSTKERTDIQPETKTEQHIDFSDEMAEKDHAPKAQPETKQMESPEIFNNEHLYIIDTRFVGFERNMLMDTLKQIEKNASKIMLIDSKNPTEEQMEILAPYVESHGLEAIRAKKYVENRKKALIGENKKRFYKVTIVESVRVDIAKTYKNTLLKPKQKPTKQKDLASKFSIRLTNVPSMEEIESVRSAQAKNKSYVIWDIENISYRNIDKVVSKTDAVGRFSLVSVEPFTQNMTDILFPYILLYGIQIHTGHNDSDEKIKELIQERYTEYKLLTIVSSDTDFIPAIRKVLEKGKNVQVLSHDSQKRGMLMRLKLDHKNLRIQGL